MQANDSSSEDSGKPPSLWERLGKSAGRGFRKAKEAAGRVSNEASHTIDRQDAERELGRLVAEKLNRDGQITLSLADDATLRALVKRIQHDSS